MADFGAKRTTFIRDWLRHRWLLDYRRELGSKSRRQTAGPQPMNDRRATNRQYYERTRDRLILRESELRPTTILELIDCLGDLPLHPADRRIARLEQLYIDLTGRRPTGSPHT